MPALSNLVDQLKSLQISQGPGDDYSGSQYSSGPVTWTRNQQTGQWGNATSSDPQIQALIDSGAIGSSNTGKFAGNVKQGAQVDYSALPQTVTGQALGDTSGMGFRTGFNVNNGQIDEPNWNVGNRSAVYNDPNYGFITPSDNVSNKEDFYDKFSGQIFPALIASGLTAGGLGAIGAVGGAGAGLSNAMPAFQSAGSALTGGKFNPLSLASLAGGISPDLARILPILQSAYGATNAAKNIKTDPVGSGLSLARLAGGLYG